MQLVKYKRVSDVQDNHLIEGKLYWMDENSGIKVELSTYVDIYADEEGKEKLASVPEYDFLNVSELIRKAETVVQVTEKAPYYDYYYCPVCGDYVEPESSYCPHCASVMGWNALE